MKCTGLVAIIIMLLLTLSGCTHHVGNFSAFASGTYKIENVGKSTLVKKNAKGESCKPIIIIFETGFPKMDEALSEALAANDGDYMMNARVYYSEWYMPLIYGSYCYKVEGDVYKTYL